MSEPPKPTLIDSIVNSAAKLLSPGLEKLFTPPVPAASPPAPTPAPTVTVDFGGKLDAIQQGIENTNALLTSLLDQMAQQQQLRQSPGGVTTSAGGNHEIYKYPFYVYNRVTEKGYEVIRMNNTSTTVPVLANSVLTLTQVNPPGGSPVLVRYFRYAGEFNLPLGVLSVHADWNGYSILEDDSAFNAPLPSRQFIIPGIQQFDFLTPHGDCLFPAFNMELGGTFRMVFTNTDGANHTVFFAFAVWVLQEVADQNILARMKAEVSI